MESKPLPTRFARAERSSQGTMDRQAGSVRLAPHLREVLDACPNPGAVLNQTRQIVYCNKAMLELAGSEDVRAVLGRRPGEALHCVHAHESAAGCGTAEACSVCGTALSILAAQNDIPAERECRLVRVADDSEEPFDLMVTTSPIVVEGDRLYLFFMVDVSHAKRRHALERIFFHDILNTAGGVLRLTDLLREFVSGSEGWEFSEMLRACAQQLVADIDGHRLLLAAENNDLVVSAVPVRTRKLVDSVVKQYKGHPAGQARIIETDLDTQDVDMLTDPALLNRVLANMLKNALEASGPGEIVTIGCSVRHGEVEFWVHNPAVIPRDIQLQLFHRSFSTRGADRGLGTYSMRLISEKYLGGKVSFRSEPGEGTCFFARFPQELHTRDYFV